MTVPIISRAAWGATPWQGTVYRVPMAEKAHFLVHYHGGVPSATRGIYVPRNVERIHLDNGWAGVGYNFLVDLDGKVYEGRGWDGVGAQCPGFNRSGIGVYVATGGSLPATPEALRSVVALYNEGCQRSGNALTKMGHRDGVETLCPGPVLYPWVRAGMPLPVVTPTPTTTPPPVVTTPPTPSLPKPLVVDGSLGPLTIRRWQQVMGTPSVDGVISTPSALVRAVQRHLNAKLNAGLVVDGVGIRSNVGGKVGPTKTIRALQRYLGTPVDGVLSSPSSSAVKELQRRLNTGRF